MQELQFRAGYAHTAAGLRELTRLIDDTFGVDVSPLDRLGHDPSVMAFGWWRGDSLVANVSLYQRRLWLLGKETRAVGVQSVAVRPQWRGRGLFRELMRQALAWADARTELVTLTTGTPALYAPFGFRQLYETTFSAGLPRQRRGQPACRELSLAADPDVALLRDLFARREPTSAIAAACDHPALFMLKAAQDPEIRLLHLERSDAVVAVRGLDGPALTLLDVIAPAIPEMAEIVAALGYQGRRLSAELTPDRLSWTPEQQRRVDNGGMVRGPFPPEDRAFMLSGMQA